MPFDLSSLYGGMDPRMAQMMQYRQQGQAAGNDMSWMDQPGAVSMPPGPMQARMQQAMQNRPPSPFPQPGAGMPMSPMPEIGMQRPPMPMRPMPPLQSLRPQGPPPGQGGSMGMPPQAQGAPQRPIMQKPMGFGGGAASQRSMPQRRRPMPTQAPSPVTQGPMTP
jgi:hypothetical protein